MFDLRAFIKTTVSGMVGREPDYKVREYALGWYNRSELTQEDLAELDAAIEAYHNRPVDPEPEPMPEILPEDSAPEPMPDESAPTEPEPEVSNPVPEIPTEPTTENNAQ